MTSNNEKTINSHKQSKKLTQSRKIISILMVMVLLFSSLPMTYGASVDFNGVVKNSVTESHYERTMISTASLKDYGLNTTLSGNTIKLSNGSVTFTFTINSNVVKVNTATMTLDSKPYFKDKVAYVPMKFIFETLNNTVGYSYATKQITVKYNGNFVFPITIKDGTKVYKFTKPAKRIVSLAPSITEILFAIGAGDMVVGRTKYCTYPAQATAIKSVGTLYEPDLEAVINLDPDVVIAATHMNEDVMNALTKAKISTLTQESPAKIDQIYTLIEQLGRLTNKTYESRALISSMKSKEDRINNIMKAIPASQRKEVYYVVGTGKSEFTAGKQTFIHEILVGAGLINVGSDVDKWSYSLEKLIEHNPDYLIGADYSFTTMKNSNNYSSLSALKSGKAIEVDTNVFSIPGPRIMDYSMKTLIEKLYPEYAYQLRF